jgi:hypothetical protein
VECDDCKKKKEPMLQRAAAGPARAATAPPSVHRVLDSPGRPLDAPARSFMEPRFGTNFGTVRVHTDPVAAESARAVDAHAYTVGQHIVFDSGRYDPYSGPGRHLLAHELAHTVQQRGAGATSPVLRLGETPEYNRLENDAARVAHAVVNQSGGSPVARASAPLLSRAPKAADATAKSAAPPTKPETSQRTWVPVKTPELAAAKVKAYALSDENPGIVLAKMNVPLKLPPEKGPVKKIWQDRAQAGGLEAIVVPGSGEVPTKSGLKQERPPAERLRQIWLQKVGWLPAKADDNWKACRTKVNDTSGGTSNFKPPRAGGATCQVDHILELQFGGGNAPNNLQMLDGDENQQSGREIFADLKSVAEGIVKAFQGDKIDIGGAKNVLIHYDSVDQASAKCGKCCEIEKIAPTLGTLDLEGAGESVSGKTGTPYPLQAGSTKATMLVTDEKKEKNELQLAESTVPENKWAATLISGFELKKWKRAGKGGGTVEAVFDATPRFPSSLKPDSANKKIIFLRQADGTLKLAAGNPHSKFHFDYLSEGVFDHMNLADDGTLSGSGTITPSFKFLPTFQVAFDKDKFAISKDIPKEKLKLPVPGMTVTDAHVGLVLAPEFKPEGHVGFELKTGAKKLLDGAIDLSADADGLVAEGKVHAFLPGVDNAEGTISLKNKHWSGAVKVETAQMKLKYVKDASIVVHFNDSDMSAQGTVNLDLPGTKGVTASMIYQNSKRRWIFKGQGAFQPPGLKEVAIGIEYDGEHIHGSAATEFEFHGLHGTINVRYDDEKFSGDGTLQIDKGKTTGTLKVKMRQVGDKAKFSGSGTVTYRVTENLEATAGIEVDEQEKVRLTGALAFPKPIPLFEAKSGEYKFFEVGVKIPIPGASIAGIGVNAHITGSLSAGYQLGPGELRDTKLEAAFNPLEDKPDLDVIMTSTLYVGGNVHISGRIAGSIMLDAWVASAEGGLAITATASLDGHVSSKVTLHYTKSRFEVDANFELLAALALTLALDAFVKGTFLGMSKEKDWNLATYRYDTGLQFGMKLKNPIHYASDQPMKLPSFDDIEWKTPTLDPGAMVAKTFASSGGTEKETK